MKPKPVTMNVWCTEMLDPIVSSSCKVLNHYSSRGTKNWPWRSILHLGLLCLNEEGLIPECVWYHYQLSPWIHDSGVALDCCIAVWPGDYWSSYAISRSPFFLSSYPQRDPVQSDWKVAEKRTSSLSSVPLQSLFLLMVSFFCPSAHHFI